MIALLLYILFGIVGSALVFLYLRSLYWQSQFKTAKGSGIFGVPGDMLEARKTNTMVEFRRKLMKENGNLFQFFGPFALYRVIIVNDPDWLNYLIVEKNEAKALVLLLISLCEDCAFAHWSPLLPCS